MVGLCALAGAAVVAYIGANDMKELGKRITTEVAVVSKALDERSKALDARVAEQSQALSATFTAQLQAVTSTTATTAYVDEKVAAAEARATTHDEARGQTLTALQQKVDGVTRDYTALKSLLDALDPRIAAVEGNYGATSASVTALDARVGGIESARAANDKSRAEEIAAIRREYNTLKDTLETAQRAIREELTSKAADAQEKMKKEYDAQLKDAVSKVRDAAATVIRNQVNAFEQRLAQLEARVQQPREGYNTPVPVTGTAQYDKLQKPAETDAPKVPQKRYTIDGLKKAQQQAQAATSTAIINPPSSLYDKIVQNERLSPDHERLVKEAATYSDKMLGIEWALRDRWLDVERLAVEGKKDGLREMIGGFEKDAPQFAEKLAARARYLLNNYDENQKRKQAPQLPPTN